MRTYVVIRGGRQCTTATQVRRVRRGHRGQRIVRARNATEAKRKAWRRPPVL